jgi:hypothetical protein
MAFSCSNCRKATGAKGCPKPTSRSPPTATFSFAARNRSAPSSSICEAGNLWPQVEDQGGADQTEAEARRDERNQHSGRETRKDDE